MSLLYGERHRAYQDMHDTRRVADAIEQVAVHEEISDMDKAFMESRDMFFLSTIDHEGRPTVSYKGGDPGFVRVIDARTLAFPLFDGNGMFFSAGNVAGNAKVGLLFIDFETPNRLRVQGEASIDENDPLLMDFVEALQVVRVRVEALWPNPNVSPATQIRGHGAGSGHGCAFGRLRGARRGVFGLAGDTTPYPRCL